MPECPACNKTYKSQHGVNIHYTSCRIREAQLQEHANKIKQKRTFDCDGNANDSSDARGPKSPRRSELDALNLTIQTPESEDIPGPTVCSIIISLLY